MKKNYSLTLFLTLCFSIVSFGQELIVNGDMENWDNSTTPTGWTKAENITQSTDSHAGTYSALRNGGSSTKDLSQTITGIIAGDSYTISFWYKASGDGTDARIWSNWKAGSSNLTDNADVLKGPNNQYLDNNGGVWTQYTVTLTAPATADTFYYEVRSYSNSIVYWDDLSFLHNTSSTDPSLTITSPADGSSIDSASSVDVSLSVSNFTVGVVNGSGVDGHIHWTVQENSDTAVDQSMKYDTNDETIAVTQGNSYTVYMELVDNSHTPISPAVNTTTTFNVEYSCDLTLGDITTTCDAITSGSDTYSGTVAFTGGNTGIPYTITPPTGVTVGGDNPDTIAAGTITFTGMTEGIDAEITFVGGANSSCDYTRTLFSPVCKPFPILENFDYTENTDLIAAADWSDASTSSTPNNIQVVEGTISNPFTSSEFPDPTGNMITLSGAGSDPFISFTESAVIFTSFLFSVNDMTTVTNSNGGYFVVLAQSSGSFRARLWLKSNDTDATKFNIGLSSGSSASNYTTASYAASDQIFVVMSYSTTDNEINVWVNPAASTFGATSGSPDITIDGASASVGRFLLRQDSSSETPSVNFDELRIDTSWSGVTPQGSTAIVNRDNIEGFTAYPNPVIDKRFTVKTSNSSVKQVNIFNVLGKKVFTQSFSGLQKTMDVSILNSGIYILKVTEEDKTVTKKLVIK